jgi:hypothetical protein
MKTDIQTFKTITGMVLIAIFITGLTVSTFSTISTTKSSLNKILNVR